MAYHVLIIENSLTLLNVAAHRLRLEKFTCALAETAELALDLMQQAIDAGKPFDAILVDLSLPGMSGSELIEHTINMPEYCDVAVMVFAGGSDSKALALAGSHNNIDIHLKSDLDLLPYRMNRFIRQLELIQSLAQKDANGDMNLDDIQTSEKLRILFVDDSPTIRAKYTSLLKTEGYRRSGRQYGERVTSSDQTDTEYGDC